MPITQTNNLVTTHSFNGQEYLIKLNIVANNMELSITDKNVGEEWQCSYDHNYIENLTLKTGNFKKFDIFAKMLKSGLLKTSQAITLDLLTYEDLQCLHVKYIRKSSNTNVNQIVHNRRYLILTYSVEFDRIIYPLPLEYCGPPDVTILIATIKRQESELTKARETIESYKNEQYHSNNNKVETVAMQSRIQELSVENRKLTDELRRARLNQQTSRSSSSKATTKSHNSKAKALETAIIKLENSVVTERRTHKVLVDKMRQEKIKLQKEIGDLRRNEVMLKQKLASSNNVRQTAIRRNASSCKGRELSPASNHSNSNRFNNVNCKTVEVDATKRGRSVNVQKYSTKMVTSRGSSKASRSSSGCETLQPSRSSSNSNSRNRQAQIQAKMKGKVQLTGRSDSSQSHCSSHAQSELIKSRLKTSERDYQMLENRINELQNLLRSNLLINS